MKLEVDTEFIFVESLDVGLDVEGHVIEARVLVQQEWFSMAGIGVGSISLLAWLLMRSRRAGRCARFSARAFIASG